jgi:hypothetical protein
LADGQSVTSWPSTGSDTTKSAAGVSGTYPVLKTAIINGQNVVRFNGSAYLTVPAVTKGTGFAMVFVGVLSGTPNYPMFVIYGDANNADLELRGEGTGKNLSVMLEGNAAKRLTTTGAPMSAVHIGEAVWDGTNVTAYLDGNSFGSSASTLPITGTDVWIGKRQDGYPLSGDIAEIIIVSTSALLIGDRQRLEGYLAWKYGLQGNLPAGHPYKSAAP